MNNTVLRSDPRFATASRTHNARFPLEPEQRPGRVQYCIDAEEVSRALQQTIDAGLRPTVRSSGHCYEDFIVNNPNGTLLDVSLMDRIVAVRGGTSGYQLGPGTMLGRAYEELYKLGGVCIPGGTCYTVTAGGHISGGGYGTLARQYGLTVDWLTAVDIVTVDSHGKAIARRVDGRHDADLFRALRGGQGSNFGIITAFYFDELPPMPMEVVKSGISWDWSGLSEDAFVRILKTYGDWMVRNSSKKDTWGLFAALHINNKDSGRISVHAEYAAPPGVVKDVSVLKDFLDQFAVCAPGSATPTTRRDSHAALAQKSAGVPSASGDDVCRGASDFLSQSWLESTIEGQGGAAIQFADRNRAKYKSCYMKQNFTDEEARAFYRMFADDRTRGLIVAIDSYGGAVNNVERAKDTAIPQRASVMKLQYMSFWKTQEEDEYRLQGIRDAYTNIYSTSHVSEQHKGTPYPGSQYEGCYINYPDVDMLQYPYWTDLYYGTGDLYPFLQGVKKKYDPHNIFHHSMSIRT